LLNNFSDDFSKAITCKVKQWIAAQPSYIRALMPNLGCEI